MKRSSQLAGAAVAVLLLAGCGARPQEAVGVSAGPTVHYLLCPGEHVTDVRLTRPDGTVLWEIRSRGSTRTSFRVGRLPPGFRQVVPFHGLAPQTRVSGPDGRPAMQFSRVPAGRILRGDGRVVAGAAFAAHRDSYCNGVRRNRAAALALGFAFLVLALLFAHRWLRGRRSADPFRRAWRK